MVLKYIILNIVVISVYLIYLNKNINYKAIIRSTIIWILVVGSINLYHKIQISIITGKSFSWGYTLLTHFLMSIVAGLMGNVVSNQIGHDDKRSIATMIASIVIAVIYVLLCFKIDFFTKHL